MKVSSATVENYQKILSQDPQSKVFAPLAEAYREMGLFDQAEKIARNGVQRHPQYVSGYVALGRILIEQQRFVEALEALTRASSLDPQNLLAMHLLGTAHLQLQQPKEALRAFKKVLFLNPQSEKAKKAVEKLEPLTADEFEDDVFQMRKLPAADTSAKGALNPSATAQFQANDASQGLDRTLSLIDALIVRNDLERAKDLVEKSLAAHPEHKGLLSRYEMLTESSYEEDAEDISPLPAREKMIFDRKVATLEKLLRRIKKVQNPYY